MRLQDRTCIVTGAARGIGQLYATRLAEEGANLVVADVLDCAETAALVRDLGREVLSLEVDVASSEATRDMARQAHERFGRIDVLVNNAGLYGGLKTQSFDAIDDEEWDRVMAINVRGTWSAIKAVYPYMKEARAGRIINISSSTYLTGVTGLCHYATSKAAVAGMTHVLARELGRHGITVNAVAPGLMLSQASKDLVSEPWIEAMAQQTALRRVGQPGDLPGTIAFLASDDAAFISGSVFVVDGGYSFH